MRSTSRKHSTLAACRRATASPQRPWSRTALPASKTCFQASAIFQAYDESRRTGKPPQPERLIQDLGVTFEIVNTNIKRWSVGSPIQAPLDALLDLMRTHNVKADDVKKLIVRVAHQGANTVDNRDMPDICMQHMCAVMLLDGIVTFESAHDEKRMKDRKVLDVPAAPSSTATMRSRGQCSRQGIVEMTLKDGRELRHHVKDVWRAPRTTR